MTKNLPVVGFTFTLFCSITNTEGKGLLSLLNYTHNNLDSHLNSFWYVTTCNKFRYVCYWGRIGRLPPEGGPAPFGGRLYIKLLP